MGQTVNKDGAAADPIEQRVMAAAKRLFVHFGYDKTTMNDIGREAGVAKSTIYARWKKKEDLFDALLWDAGRAYVEDWFARVEADPKGGTYGGWMRHALAAFFSDPFLKAVYSRNRRVLGSMLQRKGVSELYTQRMMMFRRFFKQMQAVGVVRGDLDDHALTYLLNALQYGIIQMGEIIPDEHSPPIDDVFDMMVTMIENTVTPEGGGDSDAGKAVLREFVVEIRAAMDRLEQK